MAEKGKITMQEVDSALRRTISLLGYIDVQDFELDNEHFVQVVTHLTEELNKEATDA